MLVTSAAQDDPRFRHRADPAYWHPAYERLWAGCDWPRRSLGDFIVHLAYGPIITGREVPRVAEGVALVNQGQLGVAAVDLRQAPRVPPGCDWDRPAARLQPGDLALARSGQGGVARNRLALFGDETPAVVGSFVDVVRLRDIEPVYVALFLRTRFGWGQIHRLINGVATPNLSFPEIRSLEIAVVPETWQAEWRERYFAEVYPRHVAGKSDVAAAHQRLVAQVEDRLLDQPAGARRQASSRAAGAGSARQVGNAYSRPLHEAG